MDSSVVGLTLMMAESGAISTNSSELISSTANVGGEDNTTTRAALNHHDKADLSSLVLAQKNDIEMGNQLMRNDGIDQDTIVGGMASSFSLSSTSMKRIINNRNGHNHEENSSPKQQQQQFTPQYTMVEAVTVEQDPLGSYRGKSSQPFSGNDDKLLSSRRKALMEVSQSIRTSTCVKMSVLILIVVTVVALLWISPASDSTGINENGMIDSVMHSELSFIEDWEYEDDTLNIKTNSISTTAVPITNLKNKEKLVQPDANMATSSSFLDSSLFTIDDYYHDFENDKTNQKERRKAVREAFIHAFKGYENVWGKDEYRPVSRGYHNWIRSANGFGMTIIDSLDTMVIMGLKEQYEKSLRYVKNEMPSFSTINGGISVFETTIRVVGGFLSAFDLSKEPIFLEKAKDMADRLIPAFSSPTGVPYSEINLRTGEKKIFAWTGGDCAILSELGSLQLEFRRLSELTGDNKYHAAVTKVMDEMIRTRPQNGLFPHMYNLLSGRACSNRVTLGALGDSFYEYLLKQWLMNRGTKAAERYRMVYLETVKGIFNHLVKTSRKGYTYVAEFERGARNKIDHLACFAAGMFALGGHFNVSTPEFSISNERQMEVGAEFTRTCYESYRQMPSQLGPEVFAMDEVTGDIRAGGASSYLLRPETVESLFIMWRITGDEKYRDWGWNIFQAIEKHCKVEKGGYSGVVSVLSTRPHKDDFQQSFFLAETLKYLYLLFSPNHVIPLDKFVFNTEAHPLRITKTEH
ncbi:hypothetical protein C9374_012943 [Naegleria lovaniensis]|uniref:alpha-1,2-Mannosidase n=1 Tax=Naegleria lovaniensis TaxID=51637 RepID=A0AA88GCH9_NAELO|nr:uncharacterized protein C9374_012943 [Naegleria lovaniensis]KAG2373000.1 hypothetical protein C9374_012943 [Naegleria lovaniensis]